jgi:diaminopimelate decarboxylase
MASNYNYVPKPAVVAALDGSCSVVLHRESLEDLIRGDAAFD